jgi:hypothetical protein
MCDIFLALKLQVDWYDVGSNASFAVKWDRRISAEINSANAVESRKE